MTCTPHIILHLSDSVRRAGSLKRLGLITICYWNTLHRLLGVCRLARTSMLAIMPVQKWLNFGGQRSSIFNSVTSEQLQNKKIMNGGTSDGAVELVEFRPLVAEDDGGETSKEAEDTLCEAAAAGEESSEELQTTGEDRLPEDEVKLIREPSDIDENGVVTEYEVALKYVGFGLYHVLLFLVNGVALASDAVEVLSISFVLSSSMGEEFGLTEAQNAWLSSIIFLGMLFGSYLWGTLADLVGRRSTLLTSLTVNGVFGMVSAFSPNYVFFLFCRFLSGLG